MSANRSKDRVSRCSFTFTDGRQCRMPRQFTLSREGSGHPFLCCFHARKEAQAQAAEEVGRDIRFFLSGDYLSAGDLSLALARVFAAAARGQLKPKTAGTLAYLGQTLLQTIHHAENEYINAFSTDSWRRVIFSHVKENTNYLFPAPPPAAASVPAQTPQQQLPGQAPSQTPDEPHASVEAGLQFTLRHAGPGASDHANAPAKPNPAGPNPEPGVPHGVSPSAGRNSSQAGRQLAVSNHAAAPAAQSSSPTNPDPAPSAVADPSAAVPPSTQSPNPPAAANVPAVASSSPAPSQLPRAAAEFAATILASAPSSPRPVAQSAPPRSGGFTPASSPNNAAPPSNTRQSGAASSDPPALTSPAPETAPSTGPSGLPLLAALPPRSPAPQPARPADSTHTPAATPQIGARH